MMEQIITLSGCINKKDHVWTRELVTKFIIIDPRNLYLDEMSAKYQLCRVIYDVAENGDKTAPIIGIRCIDNAETKIQRFGVIGEPTFETLLEWVKLFRGECEYKKNIDDWFYKKLIAKRNMYKKTRQKVKENDYEVAFVWFD